MGMSDYYKRLREKIGHDLLMMPSVAAVIHDDQGQVLLMRQRDGGEWSLPAGAIEPGETPARAVVREVAEETGLCVSPARDHISSEGIPHRGETCCTPSSRTTTTTSYISRSCCTVTSTLPVENSTGSVPVGISRTSAKPVTSVMASLRRSALRQVR
ncbi:MAG: NUDIX domain-containing protein [Bradymonadaceae bacterium]